MTRPRKLPITLSREEQDLLLGVLHDGSPGRLRALCIVRLMLNAGLRGCEVRNLRTADVDWNSGKVLVNGKYKKQRTLWLAAEDLDLLSRWREVREALPRQNDSLITALDGRPLGERNLRKIVKAAVRRAGLEKDPHAHALRHTFATDLLRHTRNLRLVQKALGHASLATTEIYTHVCDPELEAALKGLRNDDGK
ncbi:MAG: tyrosine-type recombinase/integrase [Deltaproteobacteria bacterium]|nr:tyrosine-type recombinase/integrase [Deltaproteobacteria bacterium]